MFMTVLLAAAETIGRTGRLFAPAGGAEISMVDPRDVAAAAAVVLTEDGHAGNAYTLTGPAAVTHHDVAAQIASAIGRPVDHLDVPGSVAREAMAAQGVPDWFADQLVILWDLIRQGAGATVTGTVRALTGQTPRSVAEFARDHAYLFSPTVAGTGR